MSFVSRFTERGPQMSDRSSGAGFLDGVFDRALANLRTAWREIAGSEREQQVDRFAGKLRDIGRRGKPLRDARLWQRAGLAREDRGDRGANFDFEMIVIEAPRNPAVSSHRLQLDKITL